MKSRPTRESCDFPCERQTGELYPRTEKLLESKPANLGAVFEVLQVKRFLPTIRRGSPYPSQSALTSDGTLDVRRSLARHFHHSVLKQGDIPAPVTQAEADEIISREDYYETNRDHTNPEQATVRVEVELNHPG